MLQADKTHVAELIAEAQEYYAEDREALSDTSAKKIGNVGNRHRRKTLLSLSAYSGYLAMKATKLQGMQAADSVGVASTITASIVSDMMLRSVALPQLHLAAITNLQLADHLNNKKHLQKQCWSPDMSLPSACTLAPVVCLWMHTPM